MTFRNRFLTEKRNDKEADADRLIVIAQWLNAFHGYRSDLGSVTSSGKEMELITVSSFPHSYESARKYLDSVSSIR